MEYIVEGNELVGAIAYGCENEGGGPVLVLHVHIGLLLTQQLLHPLQVTLPTQGTQGG